MIDEQYKKGKEQVWKGEKKSLEMGKNRIGTGSRMGFKRGRNGFETV